MFEIMLNLLEWLGLALGLLCVIIVWLVIIFVVVDEILGVIREFRKDDDELDEYGDIL